MALLGSWHRPLAASILAVALGCAKAKTEEVSPTKAPSRIEIDLPPGFSVAVDGASVGETPLASIEIKPGDHEVEVTTPCGSAKTTVTVEERATAKVSADAFRDLGFAQLTLTARTLDGKALQPTIMLGEWTAPGSSGVKLTVPACKLRLHVSSDGLGGFIEDLDLKPGQEVVRDVVLAPGPDMVRIHGGPFTIGPPLAVADMWLECCDLERHPVEIVSFDIDRTEVTAAQFRDCVARGGCKIDSASMITTGLPPLEHEQFCNTLRVVPRSNREPVTLEIPAGREDYPANCVAHWQAEQYCKWAGKRLLTDVEWQYAARGRSEKYECPHGPLRDDQGSCPEVGAYSTTHPVCANPEHNSPQDVCDLMGNVSEHGLPAVVSGRKTPSGQYRNCTLGGSHHGGGDVAYREPFCTADESQLRWTGFRCARDAVEADR